MINVNGLKRNAKNIVKKYSYAQVKVREATSNDPWGPSSTIMAEIADLTYNVVAFSEIMQMIWKRLNDHGKNWRHVYKALVVLEYLIKTGTEKVAQQCIENIFAIQTLKDFQYMEENKDYGMNIREKSKKLVALLKDTDKLKAERARALKAKSRLAESLSSVGKASLASMMSSGSIGSSGSDTTKATANSNGNSYNNYHNDSGSSSSGAAAAAAAQQSDAGALAILGQGDLDSARPQTLTEEEQQLKLALALSKEEAEQQEKTRKNDELRLKLALDVSKKTANTSPNLLDDFPSSSASTSAGPQPIPLSNVPAPTPSRSTIDDLLGLSIPAPEPTPAPQLNTISSTLSINPQQSSSSSKISEPQNDPWSVDPWQTNPNPMPVHPPPAISAQPPFNLNVSSPITMPSTLTSTLSTIPSIRTINQTNQTTNVFNAKRLMSKNPFED